MSELITAAALQGLTLEELRGLYSRVFDDLVRSDPSTPERRLALANLETIQQALCLHMASGFGPLPP